MIGVPGREGNRDVQVIIGVDTHQDEHVAVAIDRQVRDFARSTGQLAKNDQLDARILAHFGEAVRPPIRPLRDADTQVFGAVLARRRQMVAILVAEKTG